ncbi:MAG: radical SAM protein [bacterium]
MKKFDIVTAATPDYLNKLKWSVPTWTMKKQFRNKKLIIFYNGLEEKDFNFVFEYFKDVKLVHWNDRDCWDKRELMLSSFVLGVDEIEQKYFVKLDADTYFTNKKDVFVEKDFEYDLVSHKWGYTKPGYWIDILDNFVKGTNNPIDKNKRISKENRIQSFCCLHKANFVKEIKRICVEINNGRMPVPSHDTTLWYFADRNDKWSWSVKNMKRVGVGHCSKFLKMRDDICSNDSAFNNFLNDELFKKIQIEITNYCQIGCGNCDRNCGVVKRQDHMSVNQILKFVVESINQNHFWERIDIIGGEPCYHPNLKEIFDVMKIYKNKYPKCKVRFSTNGFGPKVNEILKTIPDWVVVRNSNKKSAKQKGFDAYNSAPIDNGEKKVRYCSIPWRCGLALTRYGYFSCGAGASLCEVFGKNIGVKNLKDFNVDVVKKQLKEICMYCGHSNCKSKHLINGNEISESWRKAIDNYSDNLNNMDIY